MVLALQLGKPKVKRPFKRVSETPATGFAEPPNNGADSTGARVLDEKCAKSGQRPIVWTYLRVKRQYAYPAPHSFGLRACLQVRHAESIRNTPAQFASSYTVEPLGNTPHAEASTSGKTTGDA